MHKDELEVLEVQQLNETSNSAFGEPALSYCTLCTIFSFVSKAMLGVHEVQQLNETSNSAFAEPALRYCTSCTRVQRLVRPFAEALEG